MIALRLTLRGVVERKQVLDPKAPHIAALSSLALAGFLVCGSAGAQIAFRSAASNSINVPDFRSASSGTSTSPVFLEATQNSALSGNLTINVPPGSVNGDFMLAYVGVRPNTVAITAPAGWTLVRRIDNANTNANSLAIYRKVSGGIEPASYTWTLNANTGSSGGIALFSNVSAITPLDVTDTFANTGSNTSHAAPTITSVTLNTLLVTAFTVASSHSWSTPAGMNQVINLQSEPDGATGISTSVDWESRPATGATGTRTATIAADGDVGNTSSILLRPSGDRLPIPVPAGTLANDVMVATIGWTPNSSTITAPAGWTQIGTTSANAGGVTNSLAVYQRVAGASEPFSYDWTFSAGATAVGGIQSFEAVNTSSVVNVQSGTTTASGANHDTPNVLTTANNAMVVTSHTYSSAGSWTPGACQITAGCAAQTESFDQQSGANNATGQGTTGGRVLQATAGQTGSKRATVSGNNDFGNAHIVALNPRDGNVLTINVPAGTVDLDVMIASISVFPSSTTITPPAGWTLLRRVDQATAPTVSLAVYWKLAQSEPASYGFTTGATMQSAAGGIQSFSGVNATTPINVNGAGNATASNTTHQANSVNTTVANTMIVTSHAFASSATWTPPAGMSEGFEDSSLQAQNLDGVSLEANFVAQAAIGASGNKTATAASNADVGATHTLALQSVATVTAPGSFNAFETSTAAGATTAATVKIFTKIAGTAFSLDVVVITGGVQSTFSGFVKVELLANTGTPGLGYTANCPTSNSVIQTIASAAIFAGRSTVNFPAVGNVYRDVRVRISYPTAAPTVTSCSTDSFVIRPASITLSATDTNALTAGTTRTLNNAGAVGGTVHNAGRPFTLRAQAFLSDGTTTATNYDGTPTVVAGSPACIAPPASCATGTLALGAWSGTGTMTSSTASYTEAGVFTLQLEDQAYASVDSADGSLLAVRTVPSTASITAGRFIPDHFTLLAGAITTRNDLSCAPVSTFTYMGEGIGLTITLEAHQFPSGITTNYKGTLAKLDPTVPASFSFGAKNAATDLTSRVSAPTTAGSWSNGSAAPITGTLSIARNTPVDNPDGPFTAVQFGIAPVDADGVAMGTLDQDVDGVGGNDHKTIGGTTEVRFGQLRLKNALGSERLGLVVPMQIEYWNLKGFVVSQLDSCTTFSQSNIVMSNYTQNLLPATPCKTAFPAAAITFVGGYANPALAAPGVNKNGSVDLRVRLSASSAAGSYCASVGAGVQTAASVAPLSYLLGRWNSSDDDANANTAYDDDPVARANFGIYGSQPNRFIYQRENY